MTILRYSKGANNFFANQLMNQFIKEVNGGAQELEQDNSSFFPRANILEEDDRFLIELFIPGFSKKEVAIKVEDGLLKITGEKPELEGRNFVRREFSASKVNRSFKLSKQIDQDQISAEFCDGILLVNLQKKKMDEPKIKEIPIL
ncbi:Hsp20/alpha crystallin family protein [Labilibaculum sp.]|uniref:Hsp20/alpha crystallin family protein n=1 Tax=Labilibaculum sp. TaxID=2060723 RepID=UPI003569F981